MLQNFSPVVPYSREIRRKFGKFFSLSKTGQVIDFIIALLEHFSVDSFNFDEFLIALLDFFRSELFSFLLFPTVKHLNDLLIIDYKIVNLRNL